MSEAVGPHLLWILSRGAGTTALVLSSISVCVGLVMAGRLTPGDAANRRAYHEILSLSVIVAIAVHGLVLVGDGVLHPGLLDVTVPFAWELHATCHDLGDRRRMGPHLPRTVVLRRDRIGRTISASPTPHPATQTADHPSWSLDPSVRGEPAYPHSIPRNPVESPTTWPRKNPVNLPIVNQRAASIYGHPETRRDKTDCERSLKCSQAGIEAGSIAIPAAQVLARGNTIDRVGRQAANGPELEREDRAHVAVPADAPGKPRLDARLTPETVLDLQRAAGNRAAGALIDRRRAALAERATVVEHAARPAAAVKLARKSAAEPPAPALDRAPRRSLQRKFWSRLWSGIKHIGSAIWEGAKSAGSHIIDWVESASSAVLDAIKWFGVKSWQVIEFIGTRAWEALSRLPTLAWTFISNLPVRVWRFVIDSWDSITRVADWVWKALQGAAGASWDAFVGTFKWLEHGFAGALNWLWYGIAGGASWVYDFVRAPSWDKLRDALLGSLSWLGDGIKGLAKWGWQGVVGAARWAKDGLAALGGWMWDTVCGGFWQGLDLIVDFVSMIGAGEGLQYLWGVFNHMRPLSAEEICASQVVHPSGMIPYDKVRVDDQSLLTKINGGRAVTTMHIIHAPADFPLDVVVHELTHVAQYEKVGAKYLPEAAHAQATEGYDYIGAGHKYANLRQARTKGARFKDFNREQQAQIAEDYYLWKACSAGTPSAAASCPTPALVNPTPAQQTQQAKRTQALNTMCVKTQASPPLATEAELAPFLGDMRAGDF